MAKVIFLQSRKGTSKKGNAYQMVSLAQIVDESGEKVRITDFFVEANANFEKFRFGDEVEAKFESSEFIGGRPELKSISLIRRSPFIKLQ